MPTGTVRLHRALKTSPERVYRAFLEPEAMAQWLPERIPVEMCHLGWRECLAQLAHLVEPEIPDA